MRSLYQALRETAKISTAPRRERSDTHKVPRRLREPLQNSHRATTRAIRPAQSAKKVARAMSKFAPRRNESDPTCTKLGEGCTNDIKIRNAPQRERSNTHKVPRGLREPLRNAPRHNESNPTCTKPQEGCASTHTHRLDFRETWRAPRKRRLPRFWALACRGLQSTVPAMKNEPEASEVLRLPHGI